jgi:hypothetical protein
VSSKPCAIPHRHLKETHAYRGHRQTEHEDLGAKPKRSELVKVFLWVDPEIEIVGNHGEPKSPVQNAGFRRDQDRIGNNYSSGQPSQLAQNCSHAGYSNHRQSIARWSRACPIFPWKIWPLALGGHAKGGAGLFPPPALSERCHLSFARCAQLSRATHNA